METQTVVGFGEMLQRFRLLAGLTQEELAERAQLSARAISDLERGVKTRPHLATVRQLAEGLQLSTEERSRLQLAARGRPSTAAGNHRAGVLDPGVHAFLIADVRGYTTYTLEHGDEAAARLATHFAQLVEEAVGAWEGRVVELRGDEALVVFSSARQALRAAVELQDRLRRGNEAFPLGVGIGLDAGEAVSVPGGYRGTALNLAARLCGLSKAGEILASEGVIHLARRVDGLVYGESRSVVVKGFGEPVKLIPITGSSTRSLAVELENAPESKQRLATGGFLGSLPTGTLVAREEELRRLVHAVEAVAVGQGRLVVLAGEPGIGKTRLAQELTRAAHARDFLVAAGRCYQPQQSIPYFPFLDALAMAYDAAPTGIRDQIPQRWSYLARLLPDQLDSAAVAPSDSPEAHERLFRSVSAFLLALAEERPVILMLDDLHWADSASLQLLQHVARQTRAGRVLLLGTYRDVEVHPGHPLEATLRDLSREQVMERVVLRRLDERALSFLIRETMGELDQESELAALVFRHTDGNPFFTQQVLQELVENGSLFWQNGIWKQRSIRDIDVPESVRSVIAQRVSRLGPQAQEVLQEASVLGPAFSFDDLVMMKVPVGENVELEDEIDAAFMEAASIGLVRTTGNDRFAFDHALTQQALYASLSPRRRRRLHLAAGGSMESLPARIRDKRAAELAWHFMQGDDTEKAVQYSLLAGDGSELVFAHDEAERHFRLALELSRDTADKRREAEAQERLGVVLRVMGRYEESRSMLEASARLYGEEEDLQAQGRVVAQIGLLCQMTGTAVDGIRSVLTLVNALEPLGPSHSLALLYAALVRLFDHTGQKSEQLEASRRLLDLARGLQDDRLLAEAELHQGVSLMHADSFDDALSLLQSATRRAESLGDLHTVCIALDFCGMIYHGRHQVDQAVLCHDRAAEVAERLGDPREKAHRSVEAAYCTFLTGEWNRSQAHAERAVAAALELDSLRALVQPLFTLGELSLYTGAWEDAAGYLRECVTIASHLHLDDHQREVQALLAERDLLEGDPNAALNRLQPLLESPGWEGHLSFLLQLASTRLEVGDLDGAEDAIAKAVADATHQRLSLALVDALRIQGAIADRRATPEEAEPRLQRAIQLALDISYPWGEARARHELGSLLARQGRAGEARKQLEAASAIFERLGAKPYVARTRAAVEALTP